MKTILANLILAVPIITVLVFLFIGFLILYPFYWAFFEVESNYKDDYYGRF